MQQTPKLSKRYDHVIIGYNLASLSFAYELSKKQQNFCVLDSKHINSSGAKFISSIDALVSTRVPFNGPIDDSTLELSPFGAIEHTEGTPLTFDKGAFKSFLGFGDNNITAMDAVTPYCQVEQAHPQLQVEDYWQQALDTVETSIFLDQQITDVAYEEGNVTQITLNGKTSLSGGQFYFFDQLPFIFEKAGSAMKKQASQFGKATWYSSVNLVVHHTEEPENYELDQLYLLMGSKNQPCLGVFSRIKGHLISRWETFIPAELTPDSETTGAALKEIKKQMKRAFSPNQNLAGHDHIVIHDRVFAELEKTGIQSGKLNKFNNLGVYSSLFTNQVGWAHEIICGLSAASDLQGEPKEAPETPTIATI